ncbi:terminase small subunit [Clostridium magnum]|uniref:terminase small subunit n=1 Tax=Clostridium magnum TaxID=33954 RepID=UPI0009145F71|nr:terminase small subunit [Clostridium magnum]SHJ12750.1 phage terminase small subunit [Clostridium magnum DSM 2767]
MTEINKDLVKIDYLQGMKYKEIAAKFNVSIDTVKSWVKRYGWAKDKEKVKEKGAHKETKKQEKGCTQTKKVSDSKKGCAQKTKRSKNNIDMNKDYEPIPYIENKDLNDKQKLFCIYYIKCFNATKAYQKVYECDYASAVANGSRLIANDNVKAEIERLKADKFKGAMLSAQDLLQKYIDIALSDITDYVEFGQEEVPVMTMYGPLKDEDDEVVTKMINVVKFNNSNAVDGTLISEVSQGKDGAKIKLIDKKWALDFLAKYSGLLDIPTQQKLDIERRKIELAEKQADNLDDDIYYEVDEVKENEKES